MSRIILKNATILTHLGEVQPNRNILIEDSVIKEVTQKPVEELGYLENKTETEVIDCTDLYVSPGMTNLHAHTAMNIFKGISEDVSAERWFNEMIWPYESKMEPEDVYLGTKLGIAEMINNGVTAFADHYFMEEEVLKAVQEMGIRADIAPTVFGTAPNFKERLQEVADFIEKNRNLSERVALRMGPHAPYTCPMPYLKEIVDTAKQLKTGIHLHVSETREQVAESRAAVNKTPFAVLGESDPGDMQVLVAHGLWVEPEDLQYINKEKTFFAFCPKTYMKLAMGCGNILELKDQIQFSFGTDGAASSNTLNPVEQARIFALMGKYEAFDPETYEITYLWKQLMNGHNAFSFNTGKIEKGYQADLCIWDLNKTNTFPVYNPLISILYSSDSTNVKYTMVAGDFLKKDGKLLLNETELMAEVQTRKEALLARGRGQAQVTY
ncbi:MAG: amidohydrolase family protein [Lachnospiraceae bacterium]|nr:amidohydrolase family protein [Lachnospiraceae bacterium]